MDRRPIEEIEKANPHVDRTAMERSEQAMNHLADVGINLGGYKLEPALGGTLLDRPIFSSSFDTRASRQS
ncbi:MAG: hypothetical protein OXB92_15115 [Acidimicrobiaceae bacterium]|nr:hypothetical protein [Acidimicrobiaceae bacterium]